MGRRFYRHWGGNRIFVCDKCQMYISNRNQVEAINFSGHTGRAFLFKRATNFREGTMGTQKMSSGDHIVCPVYCLGCGTNLGWKYEYAHDEKNRYKEGKFALERKLIKEIDIHNKTLAEEVKYELDLPDEFVSSSSFQRVTPGSLRPRTTRGRPLRIR